VHVFGPFVWLVALATNNVRVLHFDELQCGLWSPIVLTIGLSMMPSSRVCAREQSLSRRVSAVVRMSSRRAVLLIFGARWPFRLRRAAINGRTPVRAVAMSFAVSWKQCHRTYCSKQLTRSDPRRSKWRPADMPRRRWYFS
jgi:hypothetical protein